MAGNGSDVYSEDVWFQSQLKHHLSSLTFFSVPSEKIWNILITSCLHRASIVSKHFLLFQLMHTIIKSLNVKTI